ncbi:MAG: hypothetical protein Q7T90_09500 [Thiobacillus sp.]|nr:hypothetical protein [Thiobacillus sp.]
MRKVVELDVNPFFNTTDAKKPAAVQGARHSGTARRRNYLIHSATLAAIRYEWYALLLG